MVPSVTKWGRFSRSPIARVLAIVVTGALVWLGASGGLASGEGGSAGDGCFALTLSIGSGSGTAQAMISSAGGCPEGQYPTGYKVTVAATASGGYVWTGWKGTDDDKANPTNVTMTGDHKAKAYFSSNCYHLTLGVGSGHGTVQAMPTSAGGCPEGQYPPGYKVAVVATASDGNVWKDWKGADDDKANPSSVTMTSDRTATAYFSSNCFQLTVSVGSGHGTAQAMPASAGGCPTGQYPSGYKVTVAATATSGYVWTGWQGTDSNKANPSSVTMSGARKATAYFSSNCVQLTVSVGSGHGTAQAMPTSAGGCPTGQYPSGYSVTVVATANTGYKLSGWSGTDNNKANPTKVTMKENRQVSALFVALGTTATPTKHDPTATPTKHEATATPTKQDPTATPTKHEATATPTKQDPAATPTKQDATAAPTKQDPTATPTKQDATATPTKQDPTATPTKHEATATPTKHEATATPTKHEATATPALAVRGDADCSGHVTSIDAVFVLQLDAGMITHLGCPQGADANRDGRVNSMDATIILQIGAGLLSAR